MRQVLSQEEIDTLLSTVSEKNSHQTDVAGEKSDSHPEENHDKSDLSKSGGTMSTHQKPLQESLIKSYDLTCQDKVIRGDFSRLSIVYNELSRKLEETLSLSLRRSIEVHHVGIEFLQCRDFIGTLINPTCMNVFRFNKLEEASLVLFQRSLVYSIVDGFLGGKNCIYNKKYNQDLTKIELSIVKKFMDLLMVDLRESWKPISDPTCQFIKTETNPQLLDLLSITDVVLVSTFDLKIDHDHSRMMIMIPYSEFDSLQETSKSQPKRMVKTHSWRPIIEERLLNMGMEVKVDLGETTISLRKLMALKKGDLIFLDKRDGCECDIQVEQVKKYRAEQGLYRGSTAVKVKKVNR